MIWTVQGSFELGRSQLPKKAQLQALPQTSEAATVSPGMYGVTKGLGKSPDARLPQPRAKSQWTSCVTLPQASGAFTATAWECGLTLSALQPSTLLKPDLSGTRRAKALSRH